MTKKVVLVTGGTGLVGNGIRIAHERDPRDDETFVFLSSKDADLTDKESTRKVNHTVGALLSGVNVVFMPMLIDTSRKCFILAFNETMDIGLSLNGGGLTS